MRHIVNALLLRDDHVLLARRSPHRQAYSNCWSFPGGHVEDGETTKEALTRELNEEIGVRPLDFQLVSEVPDPTTP